MIVRQKIIGLDIGVMAGLDARLDGAHIVTQVRRSRGCDAGQYGTFFHAQQIIDGLQEGGILREMALQDRPVPRYRPSAPHPGDFEYEKSIMTA
jgi:hypothetical protein